jgi:hypothetical protein
MLVAEVRTVEGGLFCQELAPALEVSVSMWFSFDGRGRKRVRVTTSLRAVFAAVKKFSMA